MTTYKDLKDFFKSQDFKLIIAADAETRVLERRDGKKILKIPAGGVAVAFDPIAQAAEGLHIGRAKSEDEKENIGPGNKLVVAGDRDSYVLKKIFLSKEETDPYYYGYSNQTLWPLCHVAFERPEFEASWFDGFKKANEKFAKAIKEEIKGKTFIWLNDYQLCLVPKFIGELRDSTIAMFWHIPWPTWEVFRVLPNKREILESLLQCDFLAFHRGYHVRNFLNTVSRELEARIDEETSKIYFNKRVTTVKNLPMGVDSDVIKSLVNTEENNAFLDRMIKEVAKSIVGVGDTGPLDTIFKENKVILGVDRLDYTKGLRVRLLALDKFFQKYPRYAGKVVYLGIIAPSREIIPSYKSLKKEIKELADQINSKYATKNWQPISLLYKVFEREEIINFYKKADLCLVTPLDDGMNLVSKEFVIASSSSPNPGMIILSQFAGSAIDLTASIIVNPYNVEEVADSIRQGLEMDKKEKISRIKSMDETLEEKNIYEWAKEFVQQAIRAGK